MDDLEEFMKREKELTDYNWPFSVSDKKQPTELDADIGECLYPEEDED